MVELTPWAVAPREGEWWSIHVDGSASKTDCGTGIVIKTPTGEKVKYSVHFNF